MIEIDPNSSKEDALVKIIFHFTVLMEYQMMGLQSDVRHFVTRINEAISKLDELVTVEGKQTQSLYESFYSQTNAEAFEINQRAATRADSIFAETKASIEGTSNSDDDLLGSLLSEIEEKKSQPKPSVIAKDEIWSKVSKELEFVCRLEERLRPQVYTIVECLNFEDIQSQRLEHAITSFKLLNEGITNFLKTTLSNCTLDEIQVFANDLVQKTFKLYTMQEERKLFNEVFIDKKGIF